MELHSCDEAFFDQGTSRWWRPVDQCTSTRVRTSTSAPQESRITQRRYRESWKHFFWLNTCVERRALHADNDVLITVNSLFVKELIEEKFIARENRVLATLLRHMWKVTKERIRLHIRWIRGHSGDVENSIADRLADAGTRQERQHQWWRRTPLNGGWDEEGFIKKSFEYSDRNDSVEALETRWTVPSEALDKYIPALGTLTTAIAKSALAWCSVKRGRTCLEQHDPALTEVRRLCVERRREKEHLKRNTYCPSH